MIVYQLRNLLKNNFTYFFIFIKADFVIVSFKNNQCLIMFVYFIISRYVLL